MLAFAANSVLCRLALAETELDATSFTLIRLASGALMLLWLSTRTFSKTDRSNSDAVSPSWWSALALFIYAAGFSFAYLQLPSATGALILFGAVQATMLLFGLYRGERLKAHQWVGLLMALVGVVVLLFPSSLSGSFSHPSFSHSSSSPSLGSGLLMLVAGIAWGVYSLLGRGQTQPLRMTTHNFWRSLPFCLPLVVIFWGDFNLNIEGFVYGVLSGALASGAGYAIWYQVLPQLTAMRAASIQLSVPVIAALGGVVLLNEPITLFLLAVTVVVLGGLALVLWPGAQLNNNSIS